MSPHFNTSFKTTLIAMRCGEGYVGRQNVMAELGVVKSTITRRELPSDDVLSSIACSIRIDPEQINLEYEIAGIGSRFMALFVDLLIQVVAGFVIFFLALIAGISLVGHGTWAIAFWIAAGFLLQWGYFAVFEIVWKGQTPGKRQAGIRVINETGREASVYEAVARNFVRVVDSLGAYAVGVLVMFLSPQNKRLGDYVAGTIVIHDRKPEDDDIFFNTKEDVTDGINFSVLTPEDLHAIETFLQRRLDLDLQVRNKAAVRLADHFRQKCEIPSGEHTNPENFLEFLVRGYRRGARFHSR
jgi:uncharacterized RDD family membrane protein YckC